MKLLKSGLFWSLLAAFISWVVFSIFKAHAALYEQVYLDVIFQGVRLAYDYVLGSWLPFPMIWLVIIGLIVWIFWPHKPRKTILQFFSKILIGAAWIYTSFLVLWGFNYAQEGIDKSLNLRYDTVDSTSLESEVQWMIQEVNETRKLISTDTLAIQDGFMSNREIEQEVRTHLKTVISLMGMPNAGKPRVRILAPKGVLMRFKTAGIYIPQAFEGHIDGGLCQIEYPFTIAHEMSHAFGITDEGACNFTAFLTCYESKNLYFKYSALLDYSLYLMRDLYRYNPERYKYYQAQFSKGYQADIMRIRENGKKYPDILPKVRDLFYDQYLKNMGVSEGLKSYSQMVRMVMAYKKQYGLS